MALEEYRRKRDFSRSPEPSGDEAPAPGNSWSGLPHGRRFCVQMHQATRLHFDFRLEHAGVLVSWAIPRGPSLDPAMKRLAVHVEDHPVDYGGFEGVIPSGYGAGTVMLWDIGTYEWTKESSEDPERQIAKGDIKLRLQGSKLAGEFALVNTGGRHPGDDAKSWLLLKKRDDAVVRGFDARALDFSVLTGRSLAEIAADVDPVPAPTAIAFMKASPESRPFSRKGWIFELKYDGVRAMVSIGGATVRVTGRSGRDETARYPEVAALPAAVAAKQALLDGEIVAFDDQGRPSFQRLQSRINLHSGPDIDGGVRETPVSFVCFDLLQLDGRDLTGTALTDRKRMLRELLSPSPNILYADHVDRDGEAFFAALQGKGIEGMVAKRADSRYQPGLRSRDWIKVKAWQSQSCAICGFTAGRGSRGRLGALVLGVAGGGGLVHCGQVGTGFDEATLQTLADRLAAQAVSTGPFAKAPPTAAAVTWVTPELVCEVRHAGWTASGMLRHPSYVGLRDDIGIADCVREQGMQPSAADSVAEALERLAQLQPTDNWEIGGRTVHLTNLDKLMWPEDGLTKRDMIAHYVRCGPQLLPYLRDRPLSMQVFPDGVAGKSFWRKDKPAHAPEWIESWTYHGEKVKEYILVNEVATLAWVANAGVIDLHPWHSRFDEPDRPDWAVFDLDPFEPATFADVVDIAQMVKAALDHLGMHSAIKTSGQTGLQIYVPLARGPDYGAVRGWVEEVGRAIGRVEPERITWEWSVARRGGKIRIDYTQNIINKTLAAPYSLRPGPGAPVSTPIRWEELGDPELRPDRWTIATIGARIADVGDLFQDALRGDQHLPGTT